MNLFEFFVKRNHPGTGKGWVETIAVFTGNAHKAAVGKVGHYKTVDYNEYEIRYVTSEGERTAWYTFHPLEDPDPDELKGSEIKIRYNERKPWKFDTIAFPE